MKPKLSAILIATDEEHDLPGCLSSLRGLADEVVVVVDEAAVDRTEEMARSSGAKVLRRRFDDYASQRQASLEAASGEWCLWIDPDERVTPALKQTILRRLAVPDAEAYKVPFEIWFLGRRLRWGGMGRESHLRLFRREGASFVGGLVHEGLKISGRVGGALDACMSHTPYRDLSDYLGKLDRYTTLAARKHFQEGRRYHAWNHLVLPMEFFTRAVLKLAILDGYPGLVWAGLAAFHRWLKYVKLREEGVQ